MRADEAFLRRFLMASSALPPDVAAWATATLLDQLPPARRIVERDRLLRAAAELLPPAPRWAKAKRLRAEALALRRALPAAPDLTTPRGCVAAALLLRPQALSVRRLHDVLALAEGTPLEMSEAPVGTRVHGERRHLRLAADAPRARAAGDPGRRSHAGNGE